MGTNYYAEGDICPHCGHGESEIHIGKSSAGWKFLFAPSDGLRSWREWRFYLTGKRITDEYGKVVPYADFVRLVESKQNDEENWSAITAPKEAWGDSSRDSEYLDGEGYRVSVNGGFS